MATSRYFQIDFYGKGGEVCIGTITPEQFKYWFNNIKFNKYMTDIDASWKGNPGVDQEKFNKDLPPEAHFDRPYHQYSDICRIAGPEWNGENKIIVKELDTDAKILNEEDYFLQDIEDKGVDARCIAEHNAGSESCRNTYYVFGRTFNEGLMGYTQKIIETGPEGFDFSKLEIEYDNINEFKVFDKIKYDDKTYILTEDSKGTGYEFYVAKGYELR